MRRRRYLAGLAAGTSLLAGCSAVGDAGRDPDRTVTPAPVPGEGPVDPTDSSGVVPEAVGDGHVEALSGASATFGAEYAALADGEPFELTRIRSTVDGGALTYRRFDVLPLEIGDAARIFRGLWYEDGETVFRFVEEGTQSVYREPEGFDPPPAAERFDRERLVATLAGFDPTATPTADGYRLSAGTVADPERLPTGDRVAGSTEGRMSARLEPTGLVPELRAEFVASTDGEPLAGTHALAVTGRGETTVERPDPSDTVEWYRDLKATSPVEAGTATPTGDGGTVEE